MSRSQEESFSDDVAPEKPAVREPSDAIHVGELTSGLGQEGQETPTARRQDPTEKVLPRTFGRYTLERQLGRGAMGMVYLAHDAQLERRVALKIPFPHDDDLSAWRQRFLTEARAAATLQHPNICPVFEAGEVDGQPYLTMAFIEGETLAARLRREGSLSIREACELIQTIAGAMAEAHDRGIVHRDLKPANIMLDRRGQPMIMDFGLALRATTNDDLRLTLTGIALGTPCYMPPEQAGGEHDSVGPPTDVYSLGVILYELVTGRVPFHAKSIGKLLAQIVRDPPPPPQEINPAIDERLAGVILRALAKEPSDRFASATDLAASVEAYLAGAPAPAELDRARVAETTEWKATDSQGSRKNRRRIVLWAGLIVVLLALALLGVWSAGWFEPALPRPPATVFEVDQLIEFAGGQIVVGVSEAQMQSWLAERKYDKHSVMWLDATVVDGKPVFAGMAMLDDRARKWEALIDLTKEQANDVDVLMEERGLDAGSYQVSTIGGYVLDGKLTGVSLYHEGMMKGLAGVPDMFNAQLNIPHYEKKGSVVRLARPIPGKGTELYCGLFMETGAASKPRRDLQLKETELAKMLEEQRAAGAYPTSVVPYEFGGEKLFAAVFREDPEKKPWEHARNLTAAELKVKAKEWAAKKMKPVSIIVYPVDGSPRFSTVWREE